MVVDHYIDLGIEWYQIVYAWYGAFKKGNIGELWEVVFFHPLDVYTQEVYKGFVFLVPDFTVIEYLGFNAHSFGDLT